MWSYDLSVLNIVRFLFFLLNGKIAFVVLLDIKDIFFDIMSLQSFIKKYSSVITNKTFFTEYFVLF